MLNMNKKENNNDLNKIGLTIQKFREKNNLTQKDLANKLETTQSAVARMESGDQNISASTLSKINQALEINLFHINSESLTVKIKGGKKLKGSIETKTSKNGAVGLMCASILNKGKTTLKNTPRIEEVFRIAEVLESIGFNITWKNSDMTISPPEKIKIDSINKEAAQKTRSIIMFLGPLIHKLPSFQLPTIGGCRLGKRNTSPHFFALESLGVSFKKGNWQYKPSSSLKPKTVILYESGDTVTENAIMAAAGIPTTTTIKFASANYQVQEMCFFLKKLGVKIEGIGTTTLKVTGLSEINKNISYNLSEDPIESMFFLATAIVTNSSITIKRCPIDFLELELLKLKKMGFKYKKSDVYFSENQETKLVDITTYQSKMKAGRDTKIEPRPYPGLNIDNLPFFAIIATQTEGQILIHDWVYEERAIYYKELDKLGAKTILADPHRIYISGKTPLIANEVICPPALRPAAIILIGMLAADGVSVLRNIYSINRGYESIIERLNDLGASIEFESNI